MIAMDNAWKEGPLGPWQSLSLMCRLWWQAGYHPLTTWTGTLVLKRYVIFGARVLQHWHSLKRQT